MKKVVSLILAFAMLMTILPVSAKADSITLIEVIKDNAPIRATSYEEGKVIVKCKKGAVLESTGSVYNKRVNKWYKVKYKNKTCYIYSENVKEHKHNYTKLTYEGVTYKYCNCGTVVVETKEKVSKVQQSVAAYASLWGGLAVADGPAPYGEALGAAIFVLGSLVAVTEAAITKSEYDTLVTEIDLDDYAKIKNSCSVDSYRKVTNTTGENLKYIGNTCLNVMQAYLYVKVQNGSVYTSTESNARIVAALNGTYYSEIDSGNKPNYYYHYHFGPDRDHKEGKGHVFYGVNGYGQTPSE